MTTKARKGPEVDCSAAAYVGISPEVHWDSGALGMGKGSPGFVLQWQEERGGFVRSHLKNVWKDRHFPAWDQELYEDQVSV